MKIEKNKWVSIHYTLTDDEGNTLDSSVGREPLGYLHGNGYLISGLERELEGKKAGDKFSVKISPKDGYGEYNKALVLDVNRSQFDTDQEIEVGMQFQVMTPAGATIVTVKAVGPEKITIDGNHELAGKNLNFDVEVVEVREPTKDELNPHSCSGCCGEEGGCDGGCGSDCCGGCQ